MKGNDKMLDNKGFDLWADVYDKAVGLSEEANSYPFAEYKADAGDAWDNDEIYFVIDE